MFGLQEEEQKEMAQKSARETKDLGQDKGRSELVNMRLTSSVERGYFSYKNEEEKGNETASFPSSEMNFSEDRESFTDHDMEFVRT
jgi:hypothetical protein